MKHYNIKLSDAELAMAYQEFNFLMGYLGGSLKETHDTKQIEYFKNKSSFKKILVQINKISNSKKKK